MTKVMNEGWATYWHSKLMTQHFLEAKEIIDYADQHSGTVHMPPGGFNPYKIGLELFKDIERRWNRGQHGKEWERPRTSARSAGTTSMKGPREDLRGAPDLQRRELHRRVLTEEFVERHKMYQYGRDPHTGQLRIVSRDFDRIKQTLLYQLTNMGQPFIYVVDGNYCNRGELYLAHQHNGLEVDIPRPPRRCATCASSGAARCACLRRRMSRLSPLSSLLFALSSLPLLTSAAGAQPPAPGRPARSIPAPARPSRECGTPVAASRSPAHPPRPPTAAC
jgi:hypothetical protein